MICIKILHSRMSTDMKLWTGNQGWMWSEQMYINMAKICFTSCSEGHVSSQQNKYHSRGFLQEFEVSLNFVPGRELFTIYVNGLWHNFNAFVHFYADDTIIYCAQNIKMVFKELQLTFDFIQSQLCQLILIAEKTKIMLFSNRNSIPAVLTSLVFAQDNLCWNCGFIQILTVGIVIDNSFSLKLHIDRLINKLRLKLKFFLWNLSLQVKGLLLPTFYPFWIMVI